MRSNYCKQHVLFVLCFIAWIGVLRLHAQTTNPFPYCNGGYANGNCNQPLGSNDPGNSINDFIDIFATSGGVCNIGNYNSGCNGLTNNYIYYDTSNPQEVLPGQVITCTLQSGIIFNQGFAIFVDWDQNGVFDMPGEQVDATNAPITAATPTTLAFTVPFGQPGGLYRMRVRCAFNTPGTGIDPCSQFNFGETEDYNLIIKGPSGSTCGNGATLPPTCLLATNPAESIVSTYTLQACGLNYVSASVVLNKRSGNGMAAGSNQPAAMAVAGIPVCAKIQKIFLYMSCESMGAAPAINASLTNPSGSTSVIPMTQIGTGSSKCWCRSSSFSYRADVTSMWAGNGAYNISGLPVFPANNDVNGASLFIVYTDESANYTGNIVIGDGMSTFVGGGAVQRTLFGFNVCATPVVTSNFMILDDLQNLANANLALNSAGTNYTQLAGTQAPWMVVSQPGTAATAGQTSATFGVTNNGTDCFGMVMAGMYYRTACLTCPTQMTVSVASSTCQPTFNATVTAINTMPNVTYSWLGTPQTSSIAIGLAPGIRSVTVSDPFNCKAPITRTVNIVSTMSLSALGSSCIPTNSASALATGGLGAYTYTWTSSAQTTSLVTGMPTGSHTVTVSDINACQTRTAAINVTASSSVIVTNTVLCIGYTTTLSTTTPMNSYTWSPTANIVTPTNAPEVGANPSITTVYSVSGTNSVGCISSNTLQLFVVNTQTVPIINPTTCVNSTLQLTANSSYTGSTYAWVGPSGFNSAAANPTRFPASVAMSGPYSITVISAPGCTTTAVANATVFPIPTNPTINSNAPLCSGQTLNLVGGGGTSYFWEGPNTFTSNLQNVSITSATNTLHSGIFTLTARFVTGCSNQITANILVRALPVATITSNNPVCIGKNLSLAGSGAFLYTWIGPNGFSAAVQNTTIFAVTAAAAGIYSMTTTDGFGCQGSTTQSITILNNPTVTATGTTVCFGYQAILTATGTGANQFTWSGPASYNSTAQNATVASVNNPAVGVYTVVLGSALNSCTAQATANLANIPIPVMTATGTSVCSGQPGILLSNGATTFTWTGPGGFPATAIQNLTINPVTNTLTETYTVIGTAVNSCTAAITATLQARINPTATAVGTTVCQFAPASLTASGGVNYSWAGPGAYTSLQQNAFIPSVANTTIDTYTVLVTAANSCTDMTTTTLTTRPNPTVTATGTTVCLLLPAALQATTTTGIAGMTYTWTGPSGYTSNNATASIPSATSAIQQVFVVVGTAPNTCTHVTTATLVTMPLPTVVATSSVICYNYPFTINATGAIGYTWTGPSIPTSTVVQNFFIPNVDGATIGTYSVVGVSAQSCTYLATAAISTMALPSISATGTTVCFGQPATLKANGGILSGYTWSGPSAYSSNQANAFISSADYLSAGVYTVIGTAPNTCTNVNITTLSFYNLPVPVITAPPRVCMNTSAAFSSAGGTTYTWTGPYYFVSAAPSLTLPIYNILQEGTYTLGTIDTNGCYNDTTTVLKIDQGPDGVLVSDNPNQCLPYCAGFSLRTAGDAPAITNFDWEVNKTAHFSGASFNYCVGKQENSVIGTFTNALGCIAKLALSNGMKGYPVPKADFNFLPFNPIESVDQVNFKDLSTGEKINGWAWYLANNKGFTSLAQHPSYVFENAGTYPVAMIVANEYGCMDTIVKVIIVDADYKLYVPDAFTPNGDGVNDVFQPKGRGIDKYHFTVYDRWGTIVYQTDDFAKGWDGSEKGKQLTDDVYTWRINAVDVNGKVKEAMGYVTLMR